MKKLLALFLLLTTFTLFGQEERCGTDALLEQQLQDPKYRRSFFKLEKQIEQLQKSRSSMPDLPITVPVIVHIIHEGEPYGTGNHFTTEYVEETIDNLNENFAGEFSSDPTANTEINFCIANNSTTGEPIDGIRYYNWNDLYDYDINTFDDGGTNNINLAIDIGYDRPNYCNIYVLDWGGGPLGFAYIPPSNYGVYMRSAYFGITGGNYGQNRTLVHEAGHYCGLFHTFHNTSGCGPETNCNAQGDRVCDTPPTTGNWACPSNGGACGNDLVNNYMDYTYDTCMDSFTQGQTLRMLSSLETSRPGVVNNTLACGATVGIDAGVTGIAVPSIGCDPVLSGITFELQNFGDTLTEATINYTINNDLNTFDWVGNLAFGESETITLPNYNVGFGLVNIEIEVEALDDLYESNNTVSYQFDNYEGTFIDIEIDFDALPAGIDWDLYEAVDGVPVGEPIFEANYETIGFNDLYSCGNESYTFCLPEGEYVIVMTDLFGNGMNYPFCNGDYTSGDFTILNGTDTLNYVAGAWEDEVELPFVVGPPGCPSNDCRWDTDGNGFIWVNDLLVILQYFETVVEDCHPFDVDEDNIISVLDILDAISYFDTECTTGQLSPEGGFEAFLKKEKEGELVTTTLYNVMGQKVQSTDYLDTGIYILVQEWNVPNAGTFITKKKIFRE